MASRYQMVRKLGEGGMGEVFLAIQQPLDRTVAIKFLFDEIVSEKSLERFDREVEASLRIRHPNVIEIIDSGRMDDRRYYVMEYLEGYETLHDRLQDQGPLSWKAAVSVMLQLLEALQCCHEAHLIHRDLKPRNVMVDPQGHLKLMDFGLVKDLDRTALTEAGKVMGTPSYIAPELWLGQEVSPACDLFAAGAILHEILTGDRAFDAPDLAGIGRAILRESPPPLSDHDPGLEPYQSLLDRLLAKYPEDRFPAAADAAAALASTLEPSSRTIPIRSPSREVRSTRLLDDAVVTEGARPRPVGRSKGSAIAIGGGVMAVAVVVAVVAGHGLRGIERAPTATLAPSARGGPSPEGTPDPPPTLEQRGHELLKALEVGRIPDTLAHIRDRFREEAGQKSRERRRALHEELGRRVRVATRRAMLEDAVESFEGHADGFHSSRAVPWTLKRELYLQVRALEDLESVARLRGLPFTPQAVRLQSESWGLARTSRLGEPPDRALVLVFDRLRFDAVGAELAREVHAVQTGSSRNRYSSPPRESEEGKLFQQWETPGEPADPVAFRTSEPLRLDLPRPVVGAEVLAELSHTSPRDIVHLAVGGTPDDLVDLVHLRTVREPEGIVRVYHGLDGRALPAGPFHVRVEVEFDREARNWMQRRIIIHFLAIRYDLVASP